jgi:hypothetical protein
MMTNLKLTKYWRIKLKKKKEKLKAFNGKMDGKKTMEDPWN